MIRFCKLLILLAGLISWILLPSCVTIRHSSLPLSSMKSGYHRLTDQEKSLIRFVDENRNIEELDINDSIIYAINGLHVNRFIRKHENILVYKWIPRVREEAYYSMQSMHKYCRKNNITLIVIAEIYDMEEIEFENISSLEYPLFTVNIDYYKSDLRIEYSKLFTKDMLKGFQHSDDDLNKVTYLFSKSKLLETNLKIKL